MLSNRSSNLATQNSWLDSATNSYQEAESKFPGFLVCQASEDVAEHAAIAIAHHLGVAINIVENCAYMTKGDLEQILHELERDQFLFISRIDLLNQMNPDYMELIRLIDNAAERITLVASAPNPEDITQQFRYRFTHNLNIAQQESAIGGISVPIGVWRANDAASSNPSVKFVKHRKVAPPLINSYGINVAVNEPIKRPHCKLLQIVGSDSFQAAESALTVGIGLDHESAPCLINLQRTGSLLVVSNEFEPHALEGRSALKNIFHALLLSLMYKAEPREVRFMLIDNDPFEFQSYCNSAFSLCPLIRPRSLSYEKLSDAILWVSAETNKRIQLFHKLGVRNPDSFNSKIDTAKAKGEVIYNPLSLTPEIPEPLQGLPHIIIIISDLADFVDCITPQGDDFEQSDNRKETISMLSRRIREASKVGIQFICSLESENCDIGLQALIHEFKSNLLLSDELSEVLCKSLKPEVQQKVQKPGCRLVLNQMLVPALFLIPDISTSEQDRIIDWWGDWSSSDHIDGILPEDFLIKDPLYDMAVKIVLDNRKASISLIQRHLKIGYNHAARLVEQMEIAGLVGPMNSTGQRSIFWPKQGNTT